MSIENRPDFQAGLIQLKSDGFNPERTEARESYRKRIMDFIAGTAIAPCMTEKPVNIGMSDETIS